MSAHSIASVVASNVRPSNCVDISGAVDVDVLVTFSTGEAMSGEVTLAPRQYDGVLSACGDSADCWISGALLARLYTLGLATREVFGAIEASACEVAS